MPYKRVGKTVYKKVDGLKKKGSSKSAAMAKKYMRALYHAEGGRKFTKRDKNRNKSWHMKQYRKSKRG